MPLRRFTSKVFKQLLTGFQINFTNCQDKKLVTATRANSYGTPKANAYINNTLYVANSKSSGKDFQAQYGGEFLDELQKKYPQLFEDVMISTGKKMIHLLNQAMVC